MWVMLVQASSGTLGLTFQGSWHPEILFSKFSFNKKNLTFTLSWIKHFILTIPPIIVLFLHTFSVLPVEGFKMIFVQSKNHFIIVSKQNVYNSVFINWRVPFCGMFYLNFNWSICLLSGISSISIKNTNFPGSWRKMRTSSICFLTLSSDLFPIVIL